MKARIFCFALLIASSAFAASFDCKKARTDVEKTICATPRLSALDDELAAAYRNAASTRDAQRRWIAEDRNACEDSADCIEASYLTRIAAIRLANKTFARQKPLASVAGHYGEMTDICFPSEDDPHEPKCEGEAENYVDIRRGAGNSLTVKSELYFFNGHMCTIEDAPAEWIGDELRVVLLEEGEDPACVLLMKFDAGGVTLLDGSGRCRSNFCGARGGFDGITLPKGKRR